MDWSMKGCILQPAIVYVRSFKVSFIDDTYENVLELDEDILQIVSQDHKRIVDLGWYPSFNPNGQYKVKLIELVDEERQLEKWD
ncbi:hypothetical protein HQN89_32670 [Paenibacillus frigoriresistens]|uniref:hypothetical protein n=1 Tax=Paenibacillus alginolyticus TaxID=59839 RepID=UPI0015657948|nr:hypothetical protein [Paenibacillus frigoriresistens]NRF95593.1 hypothetical protein [Paenibacillus frigoriresistens]